MIKNTICCVLVLLGASLLSFAQALSNSYDTVDNKFAGWTEKDYESYEDSVFAVLYPPVIAQKLDTIFSDSSRNSESSLSDVSSDIMNAHVPNSVTLDKTKSVGQIVVHSGTSSTGAKTYAIPIDVYPGMKGFNPELSLFYNSQQGNGVAGPGWSLSGIPMISRCGKTVYYDGKSQGVLLNKDDAFILNGVRLIKKNETASNIIYESEQGNIKVKAFISGNLTKSFEVFYPDGNKGVFGNTASTTNDLFYPITSLSDLNGNKIEYTYIYRQPLPNFSDFI